MIISRKIINPDIKLHQFNNGYFVKSTGYTAICQNIDLWKTFFVEVYNAQPGQTVLLDFDKISVEYIGAFFACAELNLTLVDRTPTDTKIDFYIDFRDETDLTVLTRPVTDNLILKDYWFDYRPKDRELLASMTDKVVAVGTDLLTGTVSHTSAYEQSCRFVKLLDFTKGETGLLIQNIHHRTYPLCYHFLPVLMQCDNVYTWGVMDNLGGADKELDYISEFVNENKINHVPISAYPVTAIADYLAKTMPVTHSLKLKTTNLVNRKAVELLKEKNVERIYSLFVSSDNTVGYFIKSVTPTIDMSTFSRLGYNVPTDDFYQFDLQDHNLYVACPTLGIERTATGDKFILTQSGEYHYSGN